MLQRLSVTNFKAFKDVRTELRPLTVVIGPNGGGKTTLLQSVEFLGALVQGTLDQHLRAHGWEYKDLPRLKAPGQQFGFVAELNGEGRRVWELSLGTRRSPGVAAERVTGLDDEVVMDRRGRTMWRLSRTSGEPETIRQTLTSSWLATVEAEDESRFPELLDCARWARGVYPYIALDPARLREPSRRTSAGMGPNGENLAGFLRYIRDTDPRAFRRILGRLRPRYRHLGDVTLRAGRAGWTRIEVSESWGKDSVALNAKQISDGLLRMLAVSALHELRPAPTVLMFDEIENGVHPHVLEGLVGMLKSLTREGVQVIATTHSPIALNYVDPSDVLVATRRSSGDAALTRLSETKGFVDLSAVFDPGELWYNLGERELIQRPRTSKP